MDILGWIVFGILALGVLAYLIKNIISFTKLSEEDRKQLIIEFLRGLVVEAELLYTEHGMGKEKLTYVENMFSAKAPMAYKIFLKLIGGDLDALIEKALADIKTGFEKE